MNPSASTGNSAELQIRLGHVFRDSGLLEAALTHRSFSAEAGTAGGGDSQRLEFLGDAVLGAIAAEWLVAHRADWREGTLTRVRSRLTNAAALACVAQRLGLGGFLRLGRGETQSGGRNKTAILADALEAVWGALWLDGGPEAARQAFVRWFGEDLAAAVAAGCDDNPKGELQERLQRNGQAAPRYVLRDERGPPHERNFKVVVLTGDLLLGEGAGTSKRDAEIQAARQALTKMEAQLE